MVLERKTDDGCKVTNKLRNGLGWKSNEQKDYVEKGMNCGAWKLSEK